MTRLPEPPSPALVEADVARALAEDLGSGDVTAALLPDVPAMGETIAHSLLTAALRLIMGPFAHPLFTSMTGIGADAAGDVLNRYGLNANAFANYTGAPVTRDDQAGVLSTAASLVASGNQEAAANLLKMYGLDSNAAGDYNTLTQRALSAARVSVLAGRCTITSPFPSLPDFNRTLA